MTRRIAAWVLTAAVVSSFAVAAQTPDALIGTWTLNLAKSKYDPGPAPKSQTIKYEPTAGGFKFTTATLDAQGQRGGTETIAKIDGKDYPILRGVQIPTTRAYKRIDDRSWEVVDKVNGKVTVTRKEVLSADGKTLTVTSASKDSQGQSHTSMRVYEKQ